VAGFIEALDFGQIVGLVEWMGGTKWSRRITDCCSAPGSKNF
jgi:hypothetical protein